MSWRTFRFSDETKLWFNRFGAKKASVAWQIDSIDWHWTNPDWFIMNGQWIESSARLAKDGSFFGEFEPLKRNLLLSKIESIPRWVRNREFGHNSTKDNVGRHLNYKRRYKCFNERNEDKPDIRALWTGIDKKRLKAIIIWTWSYRNILQEIKRIPENITQEYNHIISKWIHHALDLVGKRF